jgi:hypothetical protein
VATLSPGGLGWRNFPRSVGRLSAPENDQSGLRLRNSRVVVKCGLPLKLGGVLPRLWYEKDYSSLGPLLNEPRSGNPLKTNELSHYQMPIYAHAPSKKCSSDTHFPPSGSRPVWTGYYEPGRSSRKRWRPD